jgi:DNA-binding protein HU-beta
MNKPDLINRTAEVSGLSKKDATVAVDAVFDVIAQTLANGDIVKVASFGNFEVRDRAARNGRNPATGEPVAIPATKVPAFKPSKALKESVN